MKQLIGNPISTLTVLLSLSVYNLLAQSTTPTVGFVRTTMAPGSDTIISPQVLRAPEFTGSVTNVSSADGQAVLSVTSTAMTANQFQFNGSTQPNNYYALVTSGNLLGTFFMVASNSTSTITVNLDGLNVATSDISAVEVRPCWTIGTLFPSGDLGVSFVASAGTSTSARRTQLLFPNNTSLGINRAPSSVYYYLSSMAAWVSTADSTVNANNTPILPGAFIIHRNSGGTTPVTLVATIPGQVLTNRVSYYLATRTSGQNDNPLALSVPTDYILDDLGLNTNNFTSSTGTGTSARRDTLLVIPATGTSLNRAATKVYFRYNNAWYLSGASTPATGVDLIIPAGSGLIIRKYQTTDGADRVATVQPNFSL